jgi:hypothetical protein
VGYTLQAKIHIYLWWAASHSVETQRKGIIFVNIQDSAISDSTTPTSSDCNANGDDEANSNRANSTQQNQEIKGLPSMKFAQIYVKGRLALPARMVAMHVCTPDTPFHAIIRSFVVAMTHIDYRGRVKMHVGA